MASGYFLGTFTGRSQSQVRPILEWSSTPNIAGNYSDVTVNLYFESVSSYYGYNNANNHTANININGNNNGATANFNVNAYQKVLVRQRTLQVSHNADGTKSIYLGASGNTQISWGTYDFGSTVALDTIPREAYLTNTPNFTVGNNPSMQVSNSGGLWVRSELYVNGELIKTTNHGQVSGTVAISLDSGNNNDIYAEIPNVTSASGVIRIKTYTSGSYGTQVGGNRDTNITVSIDQAANKPTFTTYTLENVDKSVEVRDSYNNLLDTNSTATLLGSNDKMIKGVSKIRATIDDADKMVALNSATEVKYRLSTSLQQVEAAFDPSNDVVLELDNVQTNSFNVTAFDSRNLTTVVPGSLSYLANYSSPILFNLAFKRDNNVDKPTKLQFAGLMFAEYFGGGTDGVENEITAHYRFKRTSHNWGALDGTFTVTIASPGVVTKSSHGLQTGDIWWAETTGNLPTGISANTHYYVIYVSANTFRLATTKANALAGTAINTSGTQSGTHTMHADSKWLPITVSVDGSGNISFDDYIDGDLGSGGFDDSQSFNIQVRAYDKLAAFIAEGTLSKGIPLIDFTQLGIALGAKYDDVEGGYLQILGKNFLNLVYPIGSIYENATDDTNPATLLGFGTWSAYGTGRVLVGYDSGDSDFNAAEKTGGAKTVTLSTSHLASHNHSGSANNGGSHRHQVGRKEVDAYDGGTQWTVIRPDGYSNDAFDSFVNSNGSDHSHSLSINNNGSGSAHNNLQPFITVFRWKRTA